MIWLFNYLILLSRITSARKKFIFFHLLLNLIFIVNVAATDIRIFIHRKEHASKRNEVNVASSNCPEKVRSVSCDLNVSSPQCEMMQESRERLQNANEIKLIIPRVRNDVENRLWRKREIHNDNLRAVKKAKKVRGKRGLQYRWALEIIIIGSTCVRDAITQRPIRRKKRIPNRVELEGRSIGPKNNLHWGDQATILNFSRCALGFSDRDTRIQLDRKIYRKPNLKKCYKYVNI